MSEKKMSSAEFRKMIAKKHDKGYRNANELTKAILSWLMLNDFYAWRNNTTGIYDERKGAWRKNAGVNGISDILGVQKGTGRLLAVEVKFGKDKTSDEQDQFLGNIKQYNGIAIVARSLSDVIDGVDAEK